MLKFSLTQTSIEKATFLLAHFYFPTKKLLLTNLLTKTSPAQIIRGDFLTYFFFGKLIIPHQRGVLSNENNYLKNQNPLEYFIP